MSMQGWNLLFERIDALAVIAESQNRKWVTIHAGGLAYDIAPETMRRFVKLARKGAENDVPTVD